MEEWVKKSDVLEMLNLPPDILSDHIYELKGVWLDEDGCSVYKDKSYINIIDIIEEEVQELARTKWQNDSCPPEFWVSLNNEDVNNQVIMITINHCGCKFSEKLFPRIDSNYGYDSVLSQMINMYNRTM